MAGVPYFIRAQPNRLFFVQLLADLVANHSATCSTSNCTCGRAPSDSRADNAAYDCACGSAGLLAIEAAYSAATERHYCHDGRSATQTIRN